MRYKRILLLVFTVIICKGLTAQIIYNESIKDIDNQSISLSLFSGKKIIFVLLPLTNQDSLCGQVRTFAVETPNVKVIGILSFEDGYTSSQKNGIKNLYSGSGILLSEGMTTRKGPEQSVIMQWLSDKVKNLHFNNEPTGIGYKYVISETGKLFAVLPRAVSFSSTGFSRIMNTNIQ